MKTTRNKNYRPLNLQLVVEQAVCKQGSVLPMTQGAQLRSGDSDDARNFYITFLARSFVLRHMTVTSNEQGRRANDERRSCRSIVLDLFGISESRLDGRITDNLISINDYTVLRRDSGYPLHTGLALYVHKSIENSVKRRLDLETEAIECIWVEIKDSKTKSLLVGYVYRNPASSQRWPHDFISMMDKVTECNANILLLGDFNIDLFKQPPAWNNATALFGLEQLVEEATRVTKFSATLIDHIYTNNKQQVFKVKVVESGISDHSAIFCHWSIKLPKPNPTGHTTITFRSFKNFNETNFLRDLSLLPFANVCDHSDPDEALSVWYDTIKPVIDKHACWIDCSAWPIHDLSLAILQPFSSLAASWSGYLGFCIALRYALTCFTLCLVSMDGRSSR